MLGVSVGLLGGEDVSASDPVGGEDVVAGVDQRVVAVLLVVAVLAILRAAMPETDLALVR